MIAAALLGALSDRARNGRIHVVDALVTGDVPSTKQVAETLAPYVNGKRQLVVLERTDELSLKSIRNLKHVNLLAVDQLNAYDVLLSDDIVFTRGAFEAFVAAKQAAEQADAAQAAEQADADEATTTGAPEQGSTDTTTEEVPA
jgi:large subunit ribosomal protein L4